jgi:ribulose-phosphate 3-epimerase
MDAHIHPSILSADFVNFERDFKTIETADAIHIDVMDGHFVPNLTFGLPMVRRMREVTKLPIDIHLMIENVDALAVSYAEAGAESVTFHLEASDEPVALASRIRAAGARAAVAIKPGTPVDDIIGQLGAFDMILVMTVEPGFGGQKFMPEMLSKVTELSNRIASEGLNVRVQIDGGVDLNNVASAAQAGADTFVAGSCVFNSADRNATIAELRELAQGNLRH